MDEKCSSLALAYLVGDKQGIDENFLDQLRAVGLSHIIVASGFHLATIVGVIRRLLGKVSRFAATTGSILLMVCYIVLVGLSASMLRASIVTMLSICFGYFGRRLHPCRAIIYAATISLLFRPDFLTDAAWLLSFASYIGIVIFRPIIQKFFYGRQKPPALSDMILTTISAQLACTPISLFFFGSISFLGVLANILISPTIPIVMGASFMVVISPSAVAGLVAVLAKGILRLQMLAVSFLSEWRWGILVVDKNEPRVLLLYVGIVLLILAMTHRERFRFRRRRLDKTSKYGKIYSC